MVSSAETREAEAIAAINEAETNAQELVTAVAKQQEQIFLSETAEADAGHQAEVAILAQVTAEASQVEAEKQARFAGAQSLAANAEKLLQHRQVIMALVNAYQAVRMMPDDDGSFGGTMWAVLANVLDSIQLQDASQNNFTSSVSNVNVDDTVGQGNSRLLAVLAGHDGDIFSADFNYGSTYIVTGNWIGQARLWDGAGNLITILAGSTAYSVAFSPDGTTILTAGWGRSGSEVGQLWDNTGNLVGILNGPPVQQATFNHSGSRILSIYGSQAMLWDSEGNLLATLEGHTDQIYSAIFSYDDTNILTTSQDGTARLWDEAGNLLITMQEHNNGVVSAAFNYDGTRILTASMDERARLWDGEGNLLNVLAGHLGSVNEVEFSRDGTRILTSSEDGTARLWDKDGTLVAVLGEERKSVFDPKLSIHSAFSPDGSLIATASEDGTVRLWDEDGNLLANLEGHTGPVWFVKFNDDGTRILTGSRDGTARLWHAHLTYDGMLAQAEYYLRLSLTEEECLMYFDETFCAE